MFKNILLVASIAFVFGGVTAKQNCAPFPNSLRSTIKYSIAEDLGSTTLYADFQCNPGYAVKGCAVRVCKNGQWNRGPPTCRAVKCPALSNPSHGAVQTPTPRRHKSTATYSCNTGYVLEGPTSRECQSDGTWSDQKPKCIPVKCSKLQTPPGCKVRHSHPAVVGSKATYKCLPHHAMQTNSKFVKGDKITRKCQADSTWSGVEPSCIKVTCGTLEQPQHSTLKMSGHHYMDTTTYTCKKGFNKMIGDKKRHCLANGTWSGDSPICTVDCGMPKHGVKHGTRKVFGTLLGNTTMYKCNECYTMKSASVVRCLKNGKWSSKPPKCIPKKYKQVKLPNSKLKVSNRMPVSCGQKITVKCPPLHSVIGAKKAKVMPFGKLKWQGKEPTCRKNKANTGKKKGAGQFRRRKGKKQRKKQRKKQHKKQRN